MCLPSPPLCPINQLPGWVKQKVLLAWQSLLGLGSGLLLDVWLPDACSVNGGCNSHPHPLPRLRLWHPFSWTRPGEPRGCSQALTLTPRSRATNILEIMQSQRVWANATSDLKCAAIHHPFLLFCVLKQTPRKGGSFRCRPSPTPPPLTHL